MNDEQRKQLFDAHDRLRDAASDVARAEQAFIAAETTLHAARSALRKVLLDVHKLEAEIDRD